MRKLYALLAGFLCSLLATTAIARPATPDVARFTYTINHETKQVVFTNHSTIGSEPGIRRAFWSFGDGTGNWSPPLQGITHAYQHPGTYVVCLKIFRYRPHHRDSILSSQECRTITINTVCKADFEKIVTPAATPLHTAFKAIPWHNDHKKPKRICWRFGDGSDTCINYPATYTGQYLVRHRYNQPGNYEVCVRIDYFGGCEARDCNAIQVGRPDSCRADFERLPVAAGNPLGAAFKAIPWHNNNRKPQRICWRFGDGSDTCINYPENYTGIYGVRHQYAARGRYEVCVKIDYYGGCDSRKCHEIIIAQPDSCRADFERIPIAGASPLLVGFRALPWHNNHKQPKRICWRFGDGTDTCINYPENYTGPYTVTHRYANAGEYETCVRIEYYGGCEAGKCREIRVPPPPSSCQVRLLEITPSATSLVRGFLAVQQSNPPRRPVRICWYFGDGDDTCIVIDPQQPLPDLQIRHTYPGPGVYRACVRLRFEGGCVAEDCKEVVIRAASNICGGFMTDSMTAPRSFRFKGFSIHAPNDEVEGIRWSFGDGSTAVGREVNHTYQQAGNYQVCMYIRTRLGCITTVCRTVRVPGNNHPALSLTPNPVINILNAGFMSTHTEQVTIRILNNNGVPVRNFVRNALTGPNHWTFDCSSLLPGLYSFVVQSPNQLASAIFIKQ